MSYFYKVRVSSLNIRDIPAIVGKSMGSYSKGAWFIGKHDELHCTTETLSKDGHSYERKWVSINTGNYACYSETVDGGQKEYYLDFAQLAGDTPPTAWLESGSSSTTNVTTTEEQENTGYDDEVTTEELENEGLFEGSSGYKPDLSTVLTFEKSWADQLAGDESSNFFNIRSVLGTFGLPYQFMPHVDPRISDSLDDKYPDFNRGEKYGDTLGIGEAYAEHIIANMPILLMSPGKPNFMASYTKEDKQSILEWMIKESNGLAESLGINGIEDLIKGTGRYYTFEYAVPEYYEYVNPLCRIAAGYMGVADYALDGVKLQSLDWQKYTISKVSGIFNGGANVTDFLSIPFYIESETQINESMGNDTTESSLSSTVNGLSDGARELQFILGNVQSATNINLIMNDADIASNAQNLNDAISSIFSGGNNFLGNIGNHLVSVATGGKMIFPKIWSGSDFSRSYDITMKLRSPDMDNLSLYFNIVAPTMHMIGFVAPHMIMNDPNSYGNPFIVRAIYKGFFNIDTGIITNMSITKGDTAQWNANGVPSSLDISFTITDLYDVLAITPTKSTDFKYDTINNTALMDYIANFCGINVYKPELGRMLTMWFVNNFTNRVRDFVSTNLWGNLRNSIAAAIVNIFHSPD